MGGKRMKPCFYCETYDGKDDSDGTVIALQSTMYGNLCPRCINEAAKYLYVRKKGNI